MLQEENSERLKPFFMVVRLLSADKATMSFDTTPSVQHETMEKAIEEGRRLAKKHPSSQFAVLKSVALCRAESSVSVQWVVPTLWTTPGVLENSSKLNWQIPKFDVAEYLKELDEAQVGFTSLGKETPCPPVSEEVKVLWTLKDLNELVSTNPIGLKFYNIGEQPVVENIWIGKKPGDEDVYWLVVRRDNENGGGDPPICASRFHKSQLNGEGEADVRSRVCEAFALEDKLAPTLSLDVSKRHCAPVKNESVSRDQIADLWKWTTFFYSGDSLESSCNLLSCLGARWHGSIDGIPFMEGVYPSKEKENSVWMLLRQTNSGGVLLSNGKVFGIQFPKEYLGTDKEKEVRESLFKTVRENLQHLAKKQKEETSEERRP